MNKIYLFLLLLISSLNYAQTEITIGKKDKLVYLDSTRQETSRKKHIFYRIIRDYYLDKNEYRIEDYYKAGVLQMEGTSKNKDKIKRDGAFVYYFENGNKKESMTFASGKITGKTTKWHENGNLKEEGEYYEAKDEKIKKIYKLNQYWDENNNHLIIDGNGLFSSGNKTDFKETGMYQNGYKDGVFEGKNLKENNSYIEKYENGKFISGKRTFADGTIKEYFEIVKKPVPKKGMNDFYSFIAKNFIQSKESIKNKISGKIFIKFVVKKDGKIEEPKIIEGLDYLLDDEAIRVLLEYGDWVPGEQRGEKVNYSFTLPINILPMQ